MNDSLGTAYSDSGGGRQIESTHRVLPAERETPRRDQKSDEDANDRRGHPRRAAHLPDDPADVDQVEISEAARKALEQADQESPDTDEN